MFGLHSPGEQLAHRYQIVAILGQGAVGTTYAALDLDTSAPVAIKAVSLQQMTDWKTLDLLEREAKILATLAHEAIPKYLDYFHLDTDRDRCFYLVQELIVGQSLATLLQQGWQPDEPEVIAIALEILDILDYLHRLNPPVIHRDLKPHNLIRTERNTITLVDFGSVQAAFQDTLSRGGTFIGTVDYMPPEQFRGQATFASDLYSLGITLIDLLTGLTPLHKIPEKRLRLDFRSVLALSPHFAQWLDHLIAPAVEDRFPAVAIAKAALLKPQTPDHRSAPWQHTHLETTTDRLTAHILPDRWTVWTSGLMVFNFSLSAIWGVGALLVVAIVVSDVYRWWQQGWGAIAYPTLREDLASLGAIGLFWWVSWWLWRLTRQARGDTIELELTTQTFRLHYQFWPLSQTVYGTLSGLSIAPRPPAQGLELRYCQPQTPLLWSGWGCRWRSHRMFNYAFGRWLAPAEQAWLLTRLSTFLDTHQDLCPPAAPGSAWPHRHTARSLRLTNNRVELQLQRDRLRLSVPALCSTSVQWMALLGVGAVMLVIPGLSLPVAAIALLPTRWQWLWAGSFSLEIDAHHFDLTWQYLAWRHQSRGQTRHLTGVGLSPLSPPLASPKRLACALRTAQQDYLFGSWLQPDEQDFVINAIEGFLPSLFTTQPS